jgi:uncharacterized protein (TIGR03084 family)
MHADIFADLADEYDRLERIFESLNDAQWSSASLAVGWTIADVVTHLALTEEAVVQTLQLPSSDWRASASGVDAEMEDQVRHAKLSGRDAFDRWRRVTRTSVRALHNADPDTKVSWAAAPLRPRTLATTRLAEHWAHALDITEPLAISYPDTDRLHHIAWLGHATLPYAFGLIGEAPQPVRAELTGPNGDLWSFGPVDAPSTIAGSAGAFCRVGAQRLSPDTPELTTSGPHATTALRVLRNYAA